MAGVTLFNQEAKMTDSTYSGEHAPIKTEKLSTKARTWYAIGGVAFLLFAALAFAIPTAATFAVELWLGVLLIVAGVFETIGAFRRHEGWSLVSEAAFGIVALIAGVLAIVFPLAGMFAFTIALIVFFLLTGLARLYQGIRRRPERSWIFNVLSGVISIGLGIFLIFLLPGAAFITLGILLAVDFLFFAVALLMAAIYGERPAAPSGAASFT